MLCGDWSAKTWQSKRAILAFNIQVEMHRCAAIVNSSVDRIKEIIIRKISLRFQVHVGRIVCKKYAAMGNRSSMHTKYGLFQRLIENMISNLGVI